MRCSPCDSHVHPSTVPIRPQRVAANRHTSISALDIEKFSQCTIDWAAETTTTRFQPIGAMFEKSGTNIQHSASGFFVVHRVNLDAARYDLSLQDTRSTQTKRLQPAADRNVFQSVLFILGCRHRYHLVRFYETRYWDEQYRPASAQSQHLPAHT